MSRGWLSPSSWKLKIGHKTKNSQPWWPLLRYYYYAAACDTDIPGDQHHRQWSYYAILVDDLLPPSWLAQRLRRIRSTRRWNKNMLLSLRASYHHNTIAMALPSPPLNDIYVCLPRGYGFWPMWCMVLHSSQWYILWISSFINHLHEQYFAYQLPCHRFNDSQWQR